MKTPKGTELPMIDLRGKQYLEVKYRIVWFREEHPDWSFETEFVLLDESSAIAKAVIKDAQGRIIATAHKREDTKGFADFHEKAETGAIGRALALLGYGTANAIELEEGDRVVDSPTVPKKTTLKPVPTEQTGEQVVGRIMKERPKPVNTGKIKAKLKWDKTWPQYKSRGVMDCPHEHLREGKDKAGQVDPYYYYCNDCGKGSIPKDLVEVVG